MSILKKTRKSIVRFRSPYSRKKDVSPDNSSVEDEAKKTPPIPSARTPPYRAAIQEPPPMRRIRRKQSRSHPRTSPAPSAPPVRPRPGRKSSKPETKRIKRFSLSLSAPEFELLAQHAQENGQTMSAFVRKLLFDGGKGLGRVHPEVVPTVRQKKRRRKERKTALKEDQ